MSKKRIHLGLAVVGVLAMSTAVEAKTIGLMSAVYGSPGKGLVCDATPAYASACTGHRSCDVEVRNTSCGDPDFLTVKQVVIKYRCGRVPHSQVVSEYGLAHVACE